MNDIRFHFKKKKKKKNQLIARYIIKFNTTIQPIGKHLNTLPFLE